MVSERKLHNSSLCKFIYIFETSFLQDKHSPQHPVLKHLFSLFLRQIGWVTKQNPHCFVNLFFSNFFYKVCVPMFAESANQVSSVLLSPYDI